MIINTFNQFFQFLIIENCIFNRLLDPIRN